MIVSPKNLMLWSVTIHFLCLEAEINDQFKLSVFTDGRKTDRVNS